jgi:DNA-binding CsgD family transcriptional regulator/PAS domain-containing protein
MSRPIDYDTFVEAVYETAVEPSLWPGLLKSFADMMGGTGASLRWCDAFTGAGTGTNSNMDPEVHPLFLSYYAARNPLRTPAEVMRRRLANWTPRLAVGEAWMPREDYVKTEFYNDFSTRFGLEWDLSIGLDAEGVNVGFINVFRSDRAGPHDQSNIELAARAQHHLIRALKLGRKFAIDGIVGEGLATVTDSSPHGLFLLAGDGRVRHLNPAAERLIAARDGLRVVGGRLTADSQDAARRLDAIIARASAAEARRRVGGSMALTTPKRRSPLSLTVIPVRSQRFSIYMTGPSVVVCVSDPDQGVAMPAGALRELFDFTPAETRVAQALLEGCSLRDAADRLGVTVFTVRGHLANIFAKTGVNRQSELVALMLKAIGMTTH